MCFETISAKELRNYIGTNSTVIVDLRDEEEYKEEHVEGAINIPYDELKLKCADLCYYNNIILYCERGNLSMLASRELEKIGVCTKNVYGGIHAWKKESNK